MLYQNQSGASATVQSRESQISMTTLDHNGNPCAALPHVVGTLTIVRCGHRESYTGSMWAMFDDGTMPLDNLAGEHIEFGPFDSIEDVEAWAVKMASRMVRTVGIVHLA